MCSCCQLAHGVMARRAHALQLIDQGSISFLSNFKRLQKMVFIASLLCSQNKKDYLEKNRARFLVVFLGKALRDFSFFMW